jgi:hypothetical protein
MLSRRSRVGEDLNPASCYFSSTKLHFSARAVPVEFEFAPVSDEQLSPEFDK